VKGPSSRQVTYGVGTRLKAPPSAELVDYFRSRLAGVDDHVFTASIDVSLAHVVMLAEESIIPREDAARILKLVLEIKSRGLGLLPLDPEMGDLLPNMENYVILQLGDDVGGKFHTGRSRGDYYVAISRLEFREAALQLMKEILDLRRVILQLAEQHVESLMPGYTHMQHAQPITLAHYLLAFVHEFERDFDRFRTAFDRVNLSPMGLGIIATTSFPLNRQRTAELLGFRGLIRNGRDLSDRDYLLELASAAGILMMHLHKLASDLYNWATSEFGMVRVADEDAVTSSMMPQKTNPVLIEMVRAETGAVYGAIVAAFAILKGSSANNTEVSEADTPGLAALGKARRTLKSVRGMLPRLRFDSARMSALSGQYWSQATDLADILVREVSVSFRQAHRTVGALVSLAYDRGLRPIDVTPAMVDEVALQVLGRRVALDAAKLRQALDPWEGVTHRKLLGGPAPEAVIPAIAEASAQLDANQAALDALVDKLASARETLELTAKEIATTARIAPKGRIRSQARPR
jgi:argininosuccinate lyase